MRKVVISVAPVSAASTSVIPKEVAADVIKSVKAGASIVHLHVRDRSGKLTDDLTDFKETVESILCESDIVIQASTGGISGMSIQQRCAPLYYNKVEMASLNCGSVNIGDMVYKNPYPDVLFCSKTCFEQTILPEIEVFEIGMIHNISLLQQEIEFAKPLLFNIVLGHRGSTPATIEHLIAMRQFIPKDSLWGITHYGRKADFSILAAAVAMGASLVRIGFEDSNILAEKTIGENVAEPVYAANNYELVSKIAGIIRALGFETATADEARNMFRLRTCK